MNSMMMNTAHFSCQLAINFIIVQVKNSVKKCFSMSAFAREPLSSLENTCQKDISDNKTGIFLLHIYYGFVC